MKTAWSFRRNPLRAAAVLCAFALALPAIAKAELVHGLHVPLSVGDRPFAVAIADLDGAGGLDLAVPNEYSDDVTILVRQADNGYEPEAGSPVAVGNRPVDAAIADFNGDGLLDIATANFGDDTVTVLLRDAAGGYTEEPGSPIAVGAAPTAVATDDLDGDGRPDLAVVNQNSNSVSVLLREAGGGFSEEPGSPFETGGSCPFDVAVADFDGVDGNDLAVVNQLTDEVSVLLRQPGGGYAPEAGSPFAVGDEPLGVVATDLDGDGLSDIATANRGSDDVTVLVRQPGGGFAEQAGSPVPAGDTPYSLVTADLNRDGLPDLAVTNEDPGTVTVLVGRAIGGFELGLNTPVGSGTQPLRLAAGDLYGNDGRVDLVVPNYAPDGTVTVLPNVTDTTIASGPSGLTYDTTPTFESVSSDPLAQFECQLDDAGFAACPTPYTAPALSAGAHTFAVRSVDDLGNPDPTPAERAFTVGTGGSATLPHPPVNLQGPRIIPVHPKPFYACDPGQWEHAVTLSYRWLQWHVKPTGDLLAPIAGWDVVATTQVYLPDPSVLPYVCEVSAMNEAGATTTAYSDAVTIAPSAPAVKTPWGSILDAIPIAHP
jgi:VCBS repeat protein